MVEMRSHRDPEHEREADEDGGHCDERDDRDGDGSASQDAEAQTQLLRATHLLRAVERAATSTATRHTSSTSSSDVTTSSFTDPKKWALLASARQSQQKEVPQALQKTRLHELASLMMDVLQRGHGLTS